MAPLDRASLCDKIQEKQKRKNRQSFIAYVWLAKLIEKDKILPVVNIERYHGQASGKRDEADGHAVI